MLASLASIEDQCQNSPQFYIFQFNFQIKRVRYESLLANTCQND